MSVRQRSLWSLLVVILFGIPFYWVGVLSLTAVGDIAPAGQLVWWIRYPQWDNYRTLFEILPFDLYLWNSLLIVSVAVPITLIVSSLTGLAMAQLAPKPQKYWLHMSLIWLIVPVAAVWLFRFQLFSWAGLVDTRWALLVPAIAGSNPLFVLLYYWTIRAIPTELIESARLDGAHIGVVWWWIIRPLVRPTTAAVLVLSFVLYWGDFVDPILYLFDTKLYTLPLGLQIVNQMDATNWPLLLAATVIMIFPIMVLCLSLQPLFLRGLSNLLLNREE